MEAGARPGGEQAEVVADLGELDGEALEHGGVEHEGLGVLRGLDEVGGEADGHARDRGEVRGAALGVAARGR